MSDTEMLIDAASLQAKLRDPLLRIIDSTAVLKREFTDGPYSVESGRESYLEAHIPGAVFVDIPAELSEPDSPFRFTLPSADRFARVMGGLGVGPGIGVVAYAQQSPIWACRLWWLLRYFGFEDVRVLDGGLTAWRNANYELSSEVVEVDARRFEARPRPELLAKKDDIVAVMSGEPACLVNALSPQAFQGLGPGAYSRPGRIPGSVSVPAQSLLDTETWRFRSNEELAHELSDLVDTDPSVGLIAYCGGGISATVDVFALAMLGREDVRLYDGSLTEWSADPTLPLELG